MQRVAVVGNSGSGKSTFAGRLARQLEVPHVELDAIFHQPGWQALERGEFRARVATKAATPGWVVDGNFSEVRDLVWRRADTIVWLDFPRRVVMRRVVVRTLRRALTREELWNGNREPWSNLWSLDPDCSIIAWSWKGHRHYRVQYRSAGADPAHAHLHFVRLRAPRAARRFLGAATGPDWTPPPK